ncbi:hypothetical protein PC115_g25998, partial [Phytophthora cactorum]
MLSLGSRRHRRKRPEAARSCNPALSTTEDGRTHS